MESSFTNTIKNILQEHFGDRGELVFESSNLLQYINIKTKSANRGSKSRGSFANLYALYVLIEDYIKHNYHREGNYSKYEGAVFTYLFKRQRELPFGGKLQNHALNHRLNEEYKKYFPTSEYIPILRNVETNRYWINENLLKVNIDYKPVNIATTVINIIDEYIKAKRDAFEVFIKTCEKLQNIKEKNPDEIKNFILALIAPNADARIFEIVSYSILKYFYNEKIVFFGFDINTLEKERLKLYKTGRTNANDGGIDFVMRPLGRFFQVTETTDVKKYFLDIDKIERFPITFVIKSNESIKVLRFNLEEGAKRLYLVDAIVQKYMSSIEEIINIPLLRERFEGSIKRGSIDRVLDEIILQSKVEFNYEEIDVDEDEDDTDAVSDEEQLQK
jgi:hypothetical protein